jgi:UDP-N-acetylmuramate--alanine ligase
LQGFKGVHRRFEVVGEYDGILLVDDYAHHPTEVRATLQSARDSYPDRRIVAMLQPHLYSRTQRFVEEFAEALGAADLAIVLDVFGSREKPLPGVSGELIASAVTRRAHPEVHYVAVNDALSAIALPLLKPGDLLITMGAGSVGRLGRELFVSPGGAA